MRFILPLIFISAATIAQANDSFDKLFNNGGCFARYFTHAELADHPKMQVKYIALSRSLLFDPENTRVLNVFISPRNTDQIFRAVANCTDTGGHVICDMKADAGSFTLEGDENGDLKLSVGPDGMAFRANSKTKVTVDSKGDLRFMLLSEVDSWPCE